MAGDRGVRTVDIDQHRIEAAFSGGDETPGIVGNEFASDRFVEKVLFGNVADRRIDIDIGVAIERFAVRQRKTAGTEDQDFLVPETEIVEQNLPQMLDIARVVRRFVWWIFRWWWS